MKVFLVTALLAFTTLTTTSQVFAHGDHGPTQVQPTKGGVIMQSEHFLIEAVGTKTEIKLYPLREDGKAIPMTEVKLEATYTLPRSKTPVQLSLVKAADHFVGPVKAGSAHRYELKVNAQIGKEKDTLTAQIETQE